MHPGHTIAFLVILANRRGLGRNLIADQHDNLLHPWQQFGFGDLPYIRPDDPWCGWFLLATYADYSAYWLSYLDHYRKGHAKGKGKENGKGKGKG